MSDWTEYAVIYQREQLKFWQHWLEDAKKNQAKSTQPEAFDSFIKTAERNVTRAEGQLEKLGHRVAIQGGAKARKAQPMSEEAKPLSPDAEALAHAYGAGPVTVSAQGGGRAHVEAVAKAVQAWNRATGVAVFRLSNDPNADIVIRTDPKDIVATSETGSSMTAAGTEHTLQNSVGTPSGVQGSINLSPGFAADSATIGHELGHAVGLAHPGPPTDPYRDTQSLMGSSGDARKISYSEAALIRSSVVIIPAPVSNRSDGLPERPFSFALLTIARTVLYESKEKLL